MSHRYSIVDVFADGGFTGNPLAVVHDADDIGVELMQRVTRWTNLSEAAFLLSPQDPAADYRVRIFEPKAELPFAGHPTLGAAAAWLDAGGVPRSEGELVQECGAGLVRIRCDGDGLAFAAPPMIRHELVDRDDLDRALDVLGVSPSSVVDAMWIDNGPGWMGVLLDDPARVEAIAAPTRTAQHFDVGVAAISGGGSSRIGGSSGGGGGSVEPAGLTVRAFFNDPDGVIREDPVTGSLNASFAQWLLAEGALTAPYVARQTSGRVVIESDEDGSGGHDGDVGIAGIDGIDGIRSAGNSQSRTVWVGGATDVRVTGSIRL